MKVHDPSSQTVFSPHRSLFFTTSPIPNGHVFSSRGPALRTALASPSAVGPDGPVDSRESSPDTTVVHSVALGEGEDAAVQRWQDNAVLRTAPPASSQPAPGTNGERRSVSDTGSARSQNSDDLESRSARLTLRVKPRVKTALAVIAEKDGVSLSETSATGLEVFARAKIHDQEKALFEPRMRAMMRREIRASDERHIYFEMRNAIASEQTRSIVTDLYKRLLTKEGYSQEQISVKMRKHYQQSRINVLKKTPQLTSMLEEYWQRTDDQADWQAHGEEARESKGSGGAGTGRA